MIGCEKLCGQCGACQRLVMALGAHDAGKQVSRWNRTEYDAVLDPSSLAELLVRALRGRGVEDVTGGGSPAEGGYVAITWPAGTYVCAVGKPMGPARAALTRLLAAGLCGPKEALRLLEEP